MISTSGSISGGTVSGQPDFTGRYADRNILTRATTTNPYIYNIGVRAKASLFNASHGSRVFGSYLVGKFGLGLLTLEHLIRSVLYLIARMIRDFAFEVIPGFDRPSRLRRAALIQRATSISAQLLAHQLSIALPLLVPKRSGVLRLSFRVTNSGRRIRVINGARYEENVWFLYPRVGQFTWRRVARVIVTRLAPGVARRAVYLSL